MHIDDASALAVTWIKSGYSGGNNNCIELAVRPAGGVYLRDSKNPSGPALMLRSDAWSAFVAGVQSGEFGAV